MVPDFIIERYLGYAHGVMGANFWIMCKTKKASKKAGDNALEGKPVAMMSASIGMLGGSAAHFSMSARLFTRVNLVATVGEDFPQEEKEKKVILRGPSLWDMRV
jgi:formylmethanofuran:tetrahydromethanopterin formyltransferase